MTEIFPVMTGEFGLTAWERLLKLSLQWLCFLGPFLRFLWQSGRGVWLEVKFEWRRQSSMKLDHKPRTRNQDATDATFSWDTKQNWNTFPWMTDFRKAENETKTPKTKQHTLLPTKKNRDFFRNQSKKHHITQANTAAGPKQIRSSHTKEHFPLMGQSTQRRKKVAITSARSCPQVKKVYIYSLYFERCFFFLVLDGTIWY